MSFSTTQTNENKHKYSRICCELSQMYLVLWTFKYRMEWFGNKRNNPGIQGRMNEIIASCMQWICTNIHTHSTFTWYQSVNLSLIFWSIIIQAFCYAQSLKQQLKCEYMFACRKYEYYSTLFLFHYTHSRTLPSSPSISVFISQSLPQKFTCIRYAYVRPSSMFTVMIMSTGTNIIHIFIKITHVIRLTHARTSTKTGSGCFWWRHFVIFNSIQFGRHICLHAFAFPSPHFLSYSKIDFSSSLSPGV